MSLTALKDLLKTTMGLDAHTVGVSIIQRAAQQRMAALGIDTDMDAYLARLQQQPGELDALIEMVVIPETWFFRDRRPFDALRTYLREEWLPNNLGNTLRVLSIPCSSGEEPYSIAMTLQDIGITLSHCHIDAVDISALNLTKARLGQYRPNSFRGEALEFRDRHFTEIEQGYALDPAIIAQVNLIQGNLLAPDFLAGMAPYDVVFCRNLLIYFDRPTQDQALAVLERLVRPQGALFMGHAEAGVLLETWAPSSRYPHAFMFRKQVDERRARQRPEFGAKPARKVARAKPAVAAEVSPRPFAGSVNQVQPAAAQALPASDTLERALQLADQGHLAEAADLCEINIREEGPCAQAFYLLGLVREAAGESDQAEEFWRKAIYLEPDHIETLTHLSVLCQRRGDSEAAARLRKRARRAQARR